MPRPKPTNTAARRRALPLPQSLVLALALALVPASGMAQTTDAPDTLAVAAEHGAAQPGATAGAADDPLALEVGLIRDTFRQRLTEATARYGAAAGDAAAALAAQREIVALKHGLERDLLELQLRLARERGDDDAVAELELARSAVIARLDDEAHQPASATTTGRAAR